MTLSNTIGDEVDEADGQLPAGAGADADSEVETAENEKAQVLKIQKAIKADKKFHEKAFDQMRSDMFAARRGYPHCRGGTEGRRQEEQGEGRR